MDAVILTVIMSKIAYAIHRNNTVKNIRKLAVLSSFLLWSSTCCLCMPALRPTSQAGPLCNPRDGTSVV